MAVISKPNNSFSGVSYNSKAQVALSAGPTYNEIHVFTNLAASQVKLINVVLNGEAIVSVSGANLKTMESYKQNPDGTGVFVIPFTNPNAKNQQGSAFGGLVTLQGEGILLEVEIGEGVGETPPTIELESVSYQAPAQAVRTYLPRIRTHTLVAGALGSNDFTAFPNSPMVAIKRAYFFGDVDRVKVERDGFTIFDMKKAWQNFQQKRLKRTPQAGVFVLDPTQYGFEAADAMNTGAKMSFIFRVELSTAGNVPILVESVERVIPFPTK